LPPPPPPSLLLPPPVFLPFLKGCRCSKSKRNDQVHTCPRVHVCVNTRVHAHIHVTYTYMYLYIYIYIYIHVHTYTYYDISPLNSQLSCLPLFF
jgi:hypothetical protein